MLTDDIYNEVGGLANSMSESPATDEYILSINEATKRRGEHRSARDLDNKNTRTVISQPFRLHYSLETLQTLQRASRP
jgi:hypothetical protein